MLRFKLVLLNELCLCNALCVYIEGVRKKTGRTSFIKTANSSAGTNVSFDQIKYNCGIVRLGTSQATARTDSALKFLPFLTVEKSCLLQIHFE
jgi:hypothetical protein